MLLVSPAHAGCPNDSSQRQCSCALLPHTETEFCSRLLVEARVGSLLFVGEVSEGLRSSRGVIDGSGLEFGSRIEDDDNGHAPREKGLLI